VYETKTNVGRGKKQKMPVERISWGRFQVGPEERLELKNSWNAEVNVFNTNHGKGGKKEKPLSLTTLNVSAGCRTGGAVGGGRRVAASVIPV